MASARARIAPTKIPHKQTAFQVCFRGFNQFTIGWRKDEPSAFSKGVRNTTKRPVCVLNQRYIEKRSSMKSSRGVSREGETAMPHAQTETTKRPVPTPAGNNA